MDKLKAAEPYKPYLDMSEVLVTVAEEFSLFVSADPMDGMDNVSRLKLRLRSIEESLYYTEILRRSLIHLESSAFDTGDIIKSLIEKSKR